MRYGRDKGSKKELRGLHNLYRTQLSVMAGHHRRSVPIPPQECTAPAWRFIMVLRHTAEQIVCLQRIAGPL